jgi:hypothetical protein
MSVPSGSTGVFGGPDRLAYDYSGIPQGFLNSIFVQKDARHDKRYNYIAMNDDVTQNRITSRPTINIGFILTTSAQRNKYYHRRGDEYSAMSSAEGVVKHLNKANLRSFDISSQPTYSCAKDKRACQMNAMSMSQYQLSRPHDGCDCEQQ